MGSDEPRDDDAPEGESFEDALLEPGPRRSTYTPPPQFVSPAQESAHEPAQEPASEPSQVDGAPVYPLDDAPAPPAFDIPSATDFSSIFPDSQDFSAPPAFPEFPAPTPDAPDEAVFEIPEFSPPPVWPSPDEPPAAFPTSLADAPPPSFGPPSPDAYDPTVFLMPPPDASAYQPPVYQVPPFESSAFEPPPFDAPPFESPSFDAPPFDSPSSFNAPAEPPAERPWYEQEADDEQADAAQAAAASVNLEDLNNLPGPSFTPPSAPTFPGEPLDEAALLAQQASPAGEPWIPRRRSLPDDILAENLAAAASQPGMTLDAMEELERQISLRDQEAREYQEWEQSMLAVGTPEALEAVERVRPDFEEIVNPTTSIPIQWPEPEPEPEPVVEDEPVLEPEPEPEPVAEPAYDSFDWNPDPEAGTEEVVDYGPPPLIEPPAALAPPSLPEAWEPGVAPVAAPIEEPDPFNYSLALPSTDESYPTIDPFADLPTPASSAPSTPDVAPLEFLEPKAPLPDDFENLLVADGFLTSEPVAVVPPVVLEEPTPADRRVGRAVRLFWLWFAANSSIVSIAFGAVLLGLGMSLRQAIIATLAGVVLSFIPLGLGTLAGKRSGLPTMVVSRATFGIRGNIVPTVVALVSRLFWGAALLWVLATSVASILDKANLEAGMSRQQLTVLSLGVGFVLAVVVAFFGWRVLARFQLAISILSFVLIVGFIVLTFDRVDLRVALQVQDGPLVTILAGAVLVFSFVGLVWANASSDVAQNQNPKSSGAGSMLWATFGTALPSFALIAYGALLAASDPTIAAGLTTDPMATVAGLLPLWYPIPLIAATALSLLSGIVISIYSGTFALASLGIRSRQSLVTLLVGLLVLGIGYLLTQVADFSVIFTDLATTLAVPVAAWAGLFAAEVMIRNRRYDTPSLVQTGGVYPAVRWGNLIAFLVITAVGFGLTGSTVSWLSWQGYIATPIGVPILTDLAGANVGVIVALLAGLLVPIIGGVKAIRRQEEAQDEAPVESPEAAQGSVLAPK